MELKKTLLVGISASAMIVAASTGASAFHWGGDDVVDDIKGNSDDNSQDVNVGSNNGGGGLIKKPVPYRYRGGSSDGFGDHNAVAVSALQQNSVQIVASADEDAIDDNYEADMDFGENTFQNQRLNNNNFNTGVNALQGNAMAVAGVSHRELGHRY